MKSDNKNSKLNKRIKYSLKKSNNREEKSSFEKTVLNHIKQINSRIKKIEEKIDALEDFRQSIPWGKSKKD
tara:strand:+ start:10224 stop:10436 length:213 start_codon:yes stop_codon:yes gene_type:complete